MRREPSWKNVVGLKQTPTSVGKCKEGSSVPKWILQVLWIFMSHAWKLSKQKDFQKAQTLGQMMTKTCLALRWNMKTKNKYMKCTRCRSNQNFIMTKCENINMKITYQDYGARLYFKLMLNRLKVMEQFTFIYTFLGT